MVLPRFLVVIPLLLAGMFLPAAAHPRQPPPGVLGMQHEAFSTKVVTVACGQTLTMQNNSNWVHIVGPGKDGTLVPATGVPITVRKLTERNDVYVTGAWRTAGVFYVTCSIHPEMTVKVVVTGC